MRRAGALIAFALVFAAMVLTPLTAGAVAPVPFSFTDHGTGVIDCGTFQDNFVDDFSAFGKTYFDAQGEPTMDILHFTNVSSDTNSVTGLTFHEHNKGIITFDYETGVTTASGAIIFAVLPGKGVVLQDVGRLVFAADGSVIFEAGPHEVLGASGDPVTPYCDALSP